MSFPQSLPRSVSNDNAVQKDDAREGEPEATASPPQPYAYETIHVTVDDDDVEERNDNEGSSQRRPHPRVHVDGPQAREPNNANELLSTPREHRVPPRDVPSSRLEELREAVELAKREVHRIDVLILRAVWKHLVARQVSTATSGRQGASAASTNAASPSPPAMKLGGDGDTTDATSTRHLVAVPSSRVDRTRATINRSSSYLFPPENATMALSRDAQLLHFSSITDLRHRSGQSTTHSGIRSVSAGLLYHEKPFLPPTRHPVIPEPDPNEYAQFNRHLFRAVVDAARRGILEQHKKEANRHAGRKELNRTTLSKSLFASSGQRGHRHPAGEHTVDPTTQPQRLQVMPSLRAAALKKVMAGSAPPGGRSDRPLPPTGAGRSPREEPEWTPSLSVLILQVARERALATLFLRQLRLDAHVRRERQQEVELRFEYFRQRRVLRAWRAHTSKEYARRRSVLSLCVALWQETVEEAHHLRATLAAFRHGLLTRKVAFDVCLMQRRRRYLILWRTRFTERRVERSMNAVAETFREQQRAAAAAAPRYIALSTPVETSWTGPLSDISPMFLQRRILSQVVQHWRSKMARREQWRVAERHHARTLSLGLISAVKKRVATPAAALAAQRTALKKLVEDARAYGRPVAVPGVLGPPQRRTFTVHVDPAPVHTFPYKEKSATRIAQTRVLCDSFRRWRLRSEGRRADALRKTHQQRDVLRRWLTQVGRHQLAQARVRELWLHWRSRLRSRRDVATADTYYRVHVLHETFTVRWGRCLMARQTAQRATLAWCLQRWWERASLRVATRVLEALRRASLFARWRQRAARRLQMKTAMLVADTVRETILLLSSVRWWRERAVQHRRVRLGEGVLLRLRQEAQLASCFSKWKRRAFGPRCPLGVPPPLPSPAVQPVLWGK